MPSPAPPPDDLPAGPDSARWPELLAKLVRGEVTADDVMAKLRPLLTAREDSQLAIEGATVDLGRQTRCGFGEVIYGEGKPADLVARIAKTQIDAGQSVLVTRAADQAAKELNKHFEHVVHNETARTIRIGTHAAEIATAITGDQAKQLEHVAVVTAGSTDAPVGQEAMETLAWMGIPFQKFDDIGVAGPQRLLNAVPDLRLASSVIVVAGMEGALPSVVGGHLDTPIFAVPTSVGYGATLGGITPLMGMLSSCSSNVAVVNIDAGFKAGYLAGLVVHQITRRLADQ